MYNSYVNRRCDLLFAFNGFAAFLAEANLRSVFEHLSADPAGLCTFGANELEIGDVNRGFALDDLTLLARITRLGMPLDHVDPFHRCLVLGRKNFQNLSHPSFVLSGDYFNLIVRLEVISAFCHDSTYH